jgi:hypothetical protein
MRPWARIATIVFSILAVALKAFSTTVSGADVVGVVLDSAIVIYLFQPGVREAFEERPLY